MKTILTLLFILFSHWSFGQITLEDCQQKARENFPLIKQYELIEQTREFTLSNANKNFLPQLSVTAIGGHIDGTPEFNIPGIPASDPSNFNLISMIQINQVIWDGGITKASKAATTAQSEIDQANVEVTLYALRERVNNLYFGVLLINEQMAQLELFQSNLERNKKRVEIAVTNGTAFKSDIDEIQVEIINVTQKITELTFNQKAYMEVLSAMIGETVSVDTEFQRPVVASDSINQEIRRPELRLFDYQRNLLEAKSSLDKSMIYPKLGLIGFGTFIEPGLPFGPSEMDRILVGGVSLSWEIGGLYKNSNNKKLTEVNLQKITTQEETFLFNTGLQLTQKNGELDRFETLIQQDQEILALKTSIKKSYETKYENGVSTLSQLLDRINEENVAKQNLILHEIQYLMTAYQYLNISGN